MVENPIMGMRLAISVLLLASSADAHAQPLLDAFRAQLQRAAQADDRHAIAAMVRYPIAVALGGVRLPIADAAAFLARYDDIFTPELRDAIARGTHEVVIEMVDGQFRITSIAVPPYAGGAPPPGHPNAAAALGTPPVAAPVENKGSGGARKPETRRIAIRVGPRPTQIPGALGRDAVDTFVLYLPKGKLASVRLERVPAGTAAIRVVHARTGAPLSARVSADGRFVSGRPPENGDYRIEVRRLGKADDGYLPYMLSLSLR